MDQAIGVWSLVAETRLWLLPVSQAWFRDRERCACISRPKFAQQGQNVLYAYQAEQIIIYT